MIDLRRNLLTTPLEALAAQARTVRDGRGPARLTYSRKVFIPLTQLCRDVCHYCTFAHPPRRGERAFLTREEVLAIARAGDAPAPPEPPPLVLHGPYPDFDYRQAVACGAGSLAAFRSETTHEVLPVEHGERFTIVSWFR